MQDCSEFGNFSVIDGETFQLNVEGIVEGTGPTGFEPNYTSVEYLEKILSTEDEDMIDRLDDENTPKKRRRFPFSHVRANTPIWHMGGVYPYMGAP
jgi:hypothetical protein